MTLEEQRRTMLAGKMYNDLTPELIQAREQAVFLTNEYNASFGQPQAEREAILSQLFKSVGHGAHFEPSFRCEFGFNISIGDNFYANFDCVMLDGGGIEIGNNVWVGGGVNINQGVTIGDNTVIGSGSVVTRSIPANVVAAGVPCRVIREITEADRTGFRPDADCHGSQGD